MPPKAEPINTGGPLTRLLTILAIKASENQYLQPYLKPPPGITTLLGVCIKVKRSDNLAEV